MNLFCRWSKIFFLIACIKEDDVPTFLILGAIFDHIFGPNNDKHFCPVFAFRRGMSNAICDLVLYLQSEGLNIKWIYPVTIPFQYLKTVFAIQYSTLSLTSLFFESEMNRYEISEVNLGKSEYISFELFEV